MIGSAVHKFMHPMSADLVLLVSKRNRGWILEAVCNEVANYYPGRHLLHYARRWVPDSPNYFFSHYSLVPEYFERHPWLKERTTIVFYTHPRDIGIEPSRLVSILRECTWVVSMSSIHAESLIRQGLPESRVRVIIPGADPSLFRYHSRGVGAVGFCSAFYSRKSPELMLELVRRMPHRPFVLIGRGWKKSSEFSELASLKNFTYVEAPYSEYPGHYQSMDVFVSPSQLEGGPIPLLEAMMSNVVPVATRTGFAPDVIKQGHNGFLFDFGQDVDTICALIDEAFTLSSDVRQTVEHLTWENFSKSIQDLLKA